MGTIKMVCTIIALVLGNAILKITGQINDIMIALCFGVAIIVLIYGWAAVRSLMRAWSRRRANRTLAEFGQPPLPLSSF